MSARSSPSSDRVLGINYFTSKAGLFFSRYLDTPPEILEEGLFAVLTYWLERTSHMVHEDWIPHRVTLIGSYGSDLQLRRAITQRLLREDPYGTRAFVQFGIERGEVRQDIETKMIVSLVGRLMDRCQDAIVAAELDPGLFGAHTQSSEVSARRVRAVRRAATQHGGTAG